MSLVAYIREDLEARIASGQHLPSQWTLACLAETYQVSFTPVRMAVDELVKKGYLLRESRGRFRANPTVLGSVPTRQPSNQTPLSIDWNSKLTDVIIRASLRGEPVFLREEAMAEQFDISRTIVRSVFTQLVGCGLLEHIPRRGWRVIPWSEEEMDAYLEIREVLELKALDLARPHIEPARIREMLQGNQPVGNPSGQRLDNRLHDYFIECAGNRYIRDFFRTQGSYYTALFDHAAPAAAVVNEMAAQHREILSHILGRRWGQAKRVLADHIRAQKPILLRLIQQMER